MPALYSSASVAPLFEIVLRLCSAIRSILAIRYDFLAGAVCLSLLSRVASRFSISPRIPLFTLLQPTCVPTDRMHRILWAFWSSRARSSVSSNVTAQRALKILMLSFRLSNMNGLEWQEWSQRRIRHQPSYIDHCGCLHFRPFCSHRSCCDLFPSPSVQFSNSASVMKFTETLSERKGSQTAPVVRDRKPWSSSGASDLAHPEPHPEWRGSQVICTGPLDQLNDR